MPRPYWRVAATLELAGAKAGAEARGAEAGAVVCKLAASKGDIWDEAEARAIVAAAAGSAGPTTTATPLAMATGSATTRVRRLVRPLPLNTVALLKAASERLCIGAGDAMHHAERLYLAGLTSYPRTETSR